MKRFSLILILVLPFFFGGQAQSPERFNKSIELGYGLKEWGSGLVVTDSVLYGAGLEFSDTTGSISPFFTSFTPSGDIRWKSILPTPYFYGTGQSGTNLQMTPKGDLLSCGTVFLDSANYTTDSSKAFLMKMDTNGNLLWRKRYRPSGALNARFQDIHIETDGDIVATGKTRYNSSFSSLDVYAIKTDPQGNVIWKDTYGGGALDQSGAIEPRDNGYLLFGRSKSFGGNDMDPYMIRIDSTGQKQWQNEYGTSTYEGFGTLTELPEGGYVGTGIRKHSSNDINFLVIRFDDSLEVQWEKEIGHSKVDQARMTPVSGPNGSILFGGNFEDTSRSDAPTGVLLKVDSTGTLLWERHYLKYGQGQNQHYLSTLKRASGSGYFLYGNHTDFYDHGTGGQNLWLLKVDSMGCDTAGCATNTSIVQKRPNKRVELKVYPSPARSRLHLERAPDAPNNASYRIYDAKGQVVDQGRFSGSRSTLSVGSLDPGVHVLSVSSDKGQVRKRFVKE